MRTLTALPNDESQSLPDLAHVTPDRPADPGLDGDYEGGSAPIGPLLTKALYTLGGVAIVAGTLVVLAGLSAV
jgi:hypothetical protein